jgi:hypothetical protein
MLKQRSWPTSWPRTLGGALPASLQRAARAARSPPGRQQGVHCWQLAAATPAPQIWSSTTKVKHSVLPPCVYHSSTVSASLINPSRSSSFPIGMLDDLSDKQKGELESFDSDNSGTIDMNELLDHDDARQQAGRLVITLAVTAIFLMVLFNSRGLAVGYIPTLQVLSKLQVALFGLAIWATALGE